jgi:hypothetical protein
MNLHKLSTVMTPNIFRPLETTHSDLIYAGHLVEMFKIMIENYYYIFDIPASNEEDLDIQVAM